MPLYGQITLHVRSFHNLLIHPPAGEHLGCLRLLVTVSPDAVNVPCIYLSESLCSVILGIYQGVELWGHTIILHLTFWGTSIFHIGWWLTHFTFHEQRMRVPSSQHPHRHVLFSFKKNDDYPTGAKWQLISLMTKGVDIFPHACWPFVYLWKNVYSSSLPVLSIGLFVFLLSCKRSLYIPNTKLLSGMWFANVFVYS